MNRRNFSTVGLACLTSAIPELARASAVASPTIQSLDGELEGSELSAPACEPLPELPPADDPNLSKRLFPGFENHYIKTTGATLRVLIKGRGKPLLLIHGHPETHVAWHKVAPTLAEAGYVVVVPDLRGYGDSSKPPYSPQSRNYSFRAMGQDLVEVMQTLGYPSFMAAGHDRGGRVLHRMCLDYPHAVQKAALLDIAPTLTMYSETSKEFATKYVWWFLQIQPSPMPEHLISLDPAYYLRDHLAVQGKTAGAVTRDAMAEYIRCYCCRGTIRAVCEDYRAAAGIDLEMDQEDVDKDNKIKAPLLVLWGAKGTVGKLWDVLSTWKSKTEANLNGHSLPCGHLIPEERPEILISEFRKFFAS